jgi:hypothetical protein
MRATISLDSLWQTIQSLSLNNQEWLLDKLQENIREQKEAETEYISKEEILAGIDAGLKDLKTGRMIPAEELLKELRHGM